jgi:hypothetical protein
MRHRVTRLALSSTGRQMTTGLQAPLRRAAAAATLSPLLPARRRPVADRSVSYRTAPSLRRARMIHTCAAQVAAPGRTGRAARFAPRVGTEPPFRAAGAMCSDSASRQRLPLALDEATALLGHCAARWPGSHAAYPGAAHTALGAITTHRPVTVPSSWRLRADKSVCACGRPPASEGGEVGAHARSGWARVLEESTAPFWCACDCPGEGGRRDANRHAQPPGCKA